MPIGKEKIFELAKSFRGRAKNCIKIARSRVEKSLQHAFRGRKEKKGTFRELWSVTACMDDFHSAFSDVSLILQDH